MSEEYPPYACSCCGVVNGDMFWDYIEHNASTLTFAEVQELCDEFDSYRSKWHKCNEEASKSVRYAARRKPYTKKSEYWETRSKS